MDSNELPMKDNIQSQLMHALHSDQNNDRLRIQGDAKFILNNNNNDLYKDCTIVLLANILFLTDSNDETLIVWTDTCLFADETGSSSLSITWQTLDNSHVVLLLQFPSIENKQQWLSLLHPTESLIPPPECCSSDEEESTADEQPEQKGPDLDFENDAALTQLISRSSVAARPSRKPRISNLSDACMSWYRNSKLQIESAIDDNCVRIFILSWNQAAKDHFVEALNTHAITSEAMKISQKAREESLKIVSKFIPLNYDLYVIGFQEAINDNLIDIIEMHLQQCDCRRVHIAPKVKGRGDSSFISPKCTGLAAFIRAPLSPAIKLLGASDVSFGITEGSKGGVAASFSLFDQNIVFISSHLAAHSISKRAQCYAAIMKAAGASLGCSHFSLLEQFHHVIFMGDLNYKVSGISPDQALSLITEGKLEDLREHDELSFELAHNRAFFNFKEARFAPDFYPTYKKRPKRTLPTNFSDPNWIHDTYLVNMEQAWYKGGGVRLRIPSYCDRILYHSLPSMGNALLPELAQDKETDNYFALNDYLGNSDHSAIICTFKLAVDLNHAIERPISPSEQCSYLVSILSIVPLGLAVNHIPRSVRVLFPLRWEQYDGVVHSQIQNCANRPLDQPLLTLHWTGPKRCVHLLLMVYFDDDCKAQCVVGLDFARTSQSTIEVLVKDGLPAKCNKHKKHQKANTMPALLHSRALVQTAPTPEEGEEFMKLQLELELAVKPF